MRRFVLRFHRWLAIVFALPLAVLIVTGLLLSVEPAIHLASRASGTLTGGRVAEILRAYDPDGTARAIFYRNYDGTIEISWMPGLPTVIVDVASNRLNTGLGPPATILAAARRLHSTLLYDLQWLVIASTVAMLVLVALGLALGWPRRQRSLAGWHKVMAWIALPLLIASPLTGLLMAFNITMGGGAAAPPSMGIPPHMSGGGNGAGPTAGLTIISAVQAAGARRDLSNMVWIRSLGPRIMMRYMEEGQFQGYFVTPMDLVAVPRNWPRSIHEGSVVR